MNEKIDLSKVVEGATHWSPAQGEHRVEAYWRPASKGYDCWAVTPGYKSYWQSNNTPLPEYAIRICDSAVWNGEGLPPVGTVCEYNNYEPHPVDVELKWSRVQIVARHTQGLDDFAVFASVSGYHGSREPKHFRPIRTPEQIAAEERERAIDEMVESKIAGGLAPWVCGEIYDAGYRKLVKP